MSLINHRYIHGVTRALGDKGICKIANYDGVADSAYEYLQKLAMGEEMPAQPSPQELQQVQNSGLSEGDIQSAAKVVQVIAEMKQQADMAATAQAGQGAIPGQPSPAGPGGAVQGTPQPPMPPAPTGGGQMGGPGGQPPMW